MTGIYGINYSNNYSLTGNYGYGYSTSAVSSAQPEEKGMVVNPGKSDVEKPGRKSSPAECETCKNRKYQHGSIGRFLISVDVLPVDSHGEADSFSQKILRLGRYIA